MWPPRSIIIGEIIPSINSAQGFCTFAIKSIMIVPDNIPKTVGYTKKSIGITPIIPTPNINTIYITANTPIVTKSFIFSLLSLIIIILLTIKFFLYSDKLKEEMKNPVLATVLATYPMSIMLLSSFFKKYIGLYSLPTWIIGICLDICVVSYATYNFIIKDKHIKNIYPTWFITFVGPAVVTVTAISYNIEILGKLFFYFSFINYLIINQLFITLTICVI